MKKEEAIQEIVRMMCENGVSIPEVMLGLEVMPAKDLFDLAVPDGHNGLVRLPFAIGKEQKPLGIFPFKDSDCYIETKEAYQRNDQCDTNRLPEIAFMQRISTVRKALNCALAQLNAPMIEGIYHARPVEGFAIPMIVEMTKDVAYDARDVAPKSPALVRYVGQLH